MENDILKNGEVLTDEKTTEILADFDIAIKNKKVKISKNHPLQKQPLKVSKKQLPKYIQIELDTI